MKQRFSDQYKVLELETLRSDMAPIEKSEKIFRSACFVLALDPEALPSVAHLEEEFRPSQIAFYKLQVIRKALIGGWKPDWNDRSQDKWSPWFYMDKPGFRFTVSFYDIKVTHTSGGSRLCFETEEQADFTGQECVALWADYFGGQLPAAKTT